MGPIDKERMSRNKREENLRITVLRNESQKREVRVTDIEPSRNVIDIVKLRRKFKIEYDQYNVERKKLNDKMQRRRDQFDQISQWLQGMKLTDPGYEQMHVTCASVFDKYEITSSRYLKLRTKLELIRRLVKDCDMKLNEVRRRIKEKKRKEVCVL